MVMAKVISDSQMSAICNIMCLFAIDTYDIVSWTYGNGPGNDDDP